MIAQDATPAQTRTVQMLISAHRKGEVLDVLSQS